jgi:hypothetical protein
MQEINFLENYNGKLFNDIFMDIKLKNPELYGNGKEFDILLRNIHLGTAKIEAIIDLSNSRVKDIFSFLNCGKPAAYQIGLLNQLHGHGRSFAPDQQLVVIGFKYTERNFENQAALLTEWWKTKIEEYGPVSG